MYARPGPLSLFHNYLGSVETAFKKKNVSINDAFIWRTELATENHVLLLLLLLYLVVSFSFF